MTAKEIRYGHTVAGKIFFMKQFDELGIKKRYMGYYIMIEIMQILINEDSRVVSFSRQVYPIIAKIFSKNVCTIERNIRNLVDKCWSKEMMIKINLQVKDGEKPTCTDFIYMVKNYILRQIM